MKDFSGGSSYMSQSGIYDATIKFASISQSQAEGSEAASINFNFDYNGESQTIYGPYIKNRAGETLDSGMETIFKLSAIAGLKDGDELDIEEETHKVGKDNKEQDFEVITQFSDLPVKIWLQEEYSINPKTKDIRKSMNIRGFFTAEGASAEELENGNTPGERLKLIEEKYATRITYKDDLTAEDVAAWKESKKAAAGGSATPAPKKAAVKKKISFS